MNKLYNWVFHFNPHKDKWTAIPREDYDNYWNGEQMKVRLESVSMSELIDVIKTLND